MSERHSAISVDPLTGDVTLIGATRAARPNEFRDGLEERCPFCPGNEAQTPPEIAADRDDTGAWRTRVFLNKYPAATPPTGEHEVVVDSPGHDDEITIAGVRMWRARYIAALERLPGATPVLFKNTGAYAGATLAHPHTQLLVISRDVPRWRMMTQRGAAYFASRATCVWCDEIAQANDEERVVFSDDLLVGYTRIGARFGWSLTIAPRACAPSLQTMSLSESDALAQRLRACVEALRSKLGERLAFNLLVPSNPYAEFGHFHWHVEVIPRLATLAGFELSTGMSIKSVLAQESAHEWRQMLASRGSI